MTLKTQGLQTLEQIRAFLEGTPSLGFEAPAREAAYDWIASELRRFGYLRLGKANKGLIRRYLGKVTGLAHAQIFRLITQFLSIPTKPAGQSEGNRPPHPGLSAGDRREARRGSDC